MNFFLVDLKLKNDFLIVGRLTLEAAGILEPRRSALEDDFEEEEEKEEDEPPALETEKVFPLLNRYCI